MSLVDNNEMHSSVLLLPTVYVKVSVNGVRIGIYRALCDSGSEVNLIRANLLQKIRYQAKNISAALVGITENAVRIKQQICVQLEPWFDDETVKPIEADFWMLPKTSSWSPIYPSQDILPQSIQNSLKTPVADPLFWKSSAVPLLLGVEVLASMMNGSSTKLNTGLVAQQTVFGNMIYGRAGNLSSQKSASIVERKTVYAIDLKELDKNLQKIWEFEDLSLCTQKDAEHEICEQMFQQSYTVKSDGRHVVKIPIKPQISELGRLREIALRRFHLLEKRGQNDTEFWEQYVQFMNEYESLGHMVEVIERPLPKSLHYYIPHHGIKNGSRFRVVFDGSCKTTANISINDAQFTGPKLQRDLSEILIRFRRHKIAVSADITKMYRQIEVTPEQWDLQRIFWRVQPNQPLKEYCLKTVTYGFASSPYLAVKAMFTGAEKWIEQFPTAVQAIKNDFYMDDCITGADTENQAIQLAKDIDIVLSKSQLPLRKWRSNSERLVQEMAGENEAAVLFGVDGHTSVLGIQWIPKDDALALVVHANCDVKVLTKRIILSIISQLFDPNGLVAPIITKAKLLVQELWKSKLNWDDPVLPHIVEQWNTLWSTIDSLNNVQIPRWTGIEQNVFMQLHGFADSSGKAYGCCIYLRIEHANKQIESHLIYAKSKVAPIKPVTIPRLELAAAQVLSQAMTFVRNAMELQNIPYFLWTDNSIALQWIQKEPHELKLFVANRVKEIQHNTNRANWYHVRTEHNPADLISRGMKPSKIINNQLWWHGPNWLTQPQCKWPKPLEVKSAPIPPEALIELKVHLVSVKPALAITMPNGERVPLLHYTNNMGKLVGVCKAFH